MKQLALHIAVAHTMLLTPLASSTQDKITLDVPTIMQDPKTWVGSAPGRPFWSEDSKWVYFNWNPEATDSDSLYKVSAAGGTPTKVSWKESLTVPTATGTYSSDYGLKVYARDGDIFLYEKKRNATTQITSTSQRESDPRFSGDESAVIFRQGQNIYRWERRSGTLAQITDFRKGKQKRSGPVAKTDAERFVKEEQADLMQVLRERSEANNRDRDAREQLRSRFPVSIYLGDKEAQRPALSPDGRYITFSLLAKSTDSKSTIVPNYVTDSGFAEDLSARQKVGQPQRPSEFAFYDLEKDTLIIVKADSLPGITEPQPYTTVAKKKTDNKEKPKMATRPVNFLGPFWSDDGKKAFTVIRSHDNKDRWIALVDFTAASLTSIERQHDDAWIGGPNIVSWNFSAGSVGWMPDNRQIWFCSEGTGYSHLYVYDTNAGETRALTEGAFEIYNPEISRDRKSWHFAANKIHPGERHFYRIPLDGGAWQQLTSKEGQNNAILSPDGKMLAIRHSYMNQPPELFIQPARTDARPKQITTSTTEAWRKYPWRVPQIVQIPAGDGKKPYARLYKPESSNGAAVIFVHGAGYLQNAHKGWSGYFREFMFHNLLADKGYTVLDIDYRASAGYGRDWRTGIYRFMGGKDLDDQIDGAQWLVAEHGIDAQRIGIYGGSYGGFITFMAMFTKPGVFAAGAALRPVSDWAHYNHGYTSNILNIPQADSIAYRRSSPIYHAEGLEGQLLICHGVIDTNVHFQDVVRLAQRLIELGKENWELALYPVEGHGFREPSSWTDEYRRILKLFEESLN